MPTKAFEQFKKTIQRSESMIAFYIKNKDIKGITFPKDIVRGAVVLSVAAFDAYVSNVFVEKLVPYIKNNPLNGDLLKFLETTGVTVKLALDLLKTDNPYKKIQALVEKYYLKHSTQKLETVNELFKRYGIEDIVSKAAAMTKGKRTAHSIEVLIEKRHQIAHNGDYSRTGKLIDIDETIFKKRIKDLELFVESLDKIIWEKVV
jgi:hypothetical protein